MSNRKKEKKKEIKKERCFLEIGVCKVGERSQNLKGEREGKGDKEERKKE